jgi:hypothetical protein
MAAGESRDRGMTQSLFLSNLEQWIVEKVSEDGLADRELVKAVKEKFRRSIDANVTYHKYMMKNAIANSEPSIEHHHKLMMEIYKSLNS